MRSPFATITLTLGVACSTPAAPTPTTATPASADRRTCCAQCTAASQRDPAGMDISIKDCRSYAGAEFNGGPGVDTACATYFESAPTRLGECDPK